MALILLYHKEYYNCLKFVNFHKNYNQKGTQITFGFHEAFKNYNTASLLTKLTGGVVCVKFCCSGLQLLTKALLIGRT